jgi:uncharacterized protein (DUF1330 family)
MAAYVVVEITVHDPAGYEEYKKLAPPAVAKYGGKYIARGGKTETLEGDWAPQRLVLLEFPTVAHAKQWLESPEYKPGRELRHKTATTQMIVVEGV